jgi:hypothetical protein
MYVDISLDGDKENPALIALVDTLVKQLRYVRVIPVSISDDERRVDGDTSRMAQRTFC